MQRSIIECNRQLRIDDPPAKRLPERWRTMEWADLTIVAFSICLWSGIGWLKEAFLEWCAYQTYRKRDEERLAEYERKAEENRLWASRLAQKDASQ